MPLELPQKEGNAHCEKISVICQICRVRAIVVEWVSTSYPTAAQVRPRLVHSQKMGSDLVLQRSSFRFILAVAVLFTQHNCFLHVWMRLRWNPPFSLSLKRECLSELAVKKTKQTNKHTHPQDIRNMTFRTTCCWTVRSSFADLLKS